MKNFFKFPNIDEEDRRRRILVSIFLFFGILTLLAFALFHFFKSNFSTFYVNTLACFIFFICLVRLQNIQNSKLLFRFIAPIFIALLLYLLISESKTGSTILWMYTFPIVALLLFGKKEGLFWITILFFLAMLIMLFPPFPYTFHYDAGTKIRFPISFILISIFSYYIESIRWHTHASLMKEQEKSQKYLNVAGVMLTVLNPKGEITLINQKGCEILEVKESEVIGKNWFDNFILQDMVDEIKDVFAKLMAGETDPVEYYENPIITKAGNERIIAFHNSVLTDEEGYVNGILFSGEDITDSKLLEVEREELIAKLTKAIDEIQTLQGIIPICASCKKIRDDEGYWNQIESYIQKHSEAQFSHSICPECTKKIYPDLDE